MLSKTVLKRPIPRMRYDMKQPPLLIEPPDALTRPRMSLAARLLNVFAVPAEVFNDIKGSPASVSNWLVPGFLAAVVGAVSVLVVLSQPTVEKQLRQTQTTLLEKAAKAGKLSEQERRVAETLTSTGAVRVLWLAAAVMGSFIYILWWGFLLWFLGRVLLKVPLPFSKTLEVAGLATMVNVLGGIVALLLITQFGHGETGSSLAVVVKDFESARKGHAFGIATTIFAFWVVGVRSIGLARLADVPYMRAAWLVVACWMLEQSLLVITGLGQLAT
jgi:hypothetical protein